MMMMVLTRIVVSIPTARIQSTIVISHFSVMRFRLVGARITCDVSTWR